MSIIDKFVSCETRHYQYLYVTFQNIKGMEKLRLIQNQKNTNQQNGIDPNQTNKKTSTSHDVPEEKKRLYYFHHIWGFLLALTTAFFRATGAAASQGLNGAVPRWNLATYRFATRLLSGIIYFCVRRKLPSIQKEQIIYLIMNSLTYLTYNICYYMAADFIALDAVGSIFQVRALHLKRKVSRT